MTISNSAIKDIAKKILKTNYIGSFAVVTIFIAAVFMCYNIFALLSFVTGAVFSTISFIVFSFFTLSPLFFGVIRYFWRLSCGVIDNPIAIFNYFGRREIYFKTLRLAFSLIARIVLYYFVFSIPVYALTLISGSWLYSVLNMPIPIWTVNLAGVINTLRLVAFLGTFFSAVKYYLAPMLFVADENMDIAEAIHLSTVISRKTTFDFIFYLFSFLGWLLLCLLIIPLIFIVPYIITSYLVHCSCAVNSFNEEIARINRDDIPTYIAGV